MDFMTFTLNTPMFDFLVLSIDQQFQGRNRKYYKITQSGKIRQEHLKKECKEYITIIDDIVNGGMGND